MVNFHIAFDDGDALLGNYFNESKTDITSFIEIECADRSITEIPSPQCNQAYIDMRLPQINADNFLFLAYSHGDNDSLLANGGFFIKKNVNSVLFANSLFYAMCCLTGKELGRDLVVNGCHAYIGYNDYAVALLGTYQKLSIDCDNHGIKNFIRGTTIGESFNLMKDNFTVQIDILEASGEPLLAAYLRSNRDALIFDGNPGLIFTDFRIN